MQEVVYIFSDNVITIIITNAITLKLPGYTAELSFRNWDMTTLLHRKISSQI